MRGILFFLGLLLAVIGVALIALGVDGLRTPTPCYINQCPSIFSTSYANYWGEVYAGLAILILGVAMMFLSRRLKTEVK